MPNKLTTQSFIEKSKKMYGNLFEYDKVNYTTGLGNVILTCNNHNIEFLVEPKYHLSQRAQKGCPICGQNTKLAKLRLGSDEILERFKKVHGETYQYGQLECGNNKRKIDIFCTKCSTVFQQKIYHHLQGSGCINCYNKLRGASQRRTQEEFIKLASLANNDKYDYSKVDYKNKDSKVVVICPEHGKWETLPSNHIKGVGCFHCGIERIKKINSENPTGWNYKMWGDGGSKSKYFDSFKVYIIECEDFKTNEVFYKIGKTFSTLKRRFPSTESLPYSYSILHTIEGSAREICELENKMKNDNKERKYIPTKPFKGMQECFTGVNLPQLKTFFGN